MLRSILGLIPFIGTLFLIAIILVEIEDKYIKLKVICICLIISGHLMCSTTLFMLLGVIKI